MASCRPLDEDPQQTVGVDLTFIGTAEGDSDREGDSGTPIGGSVGYVVKRAVRLLDGTSLVS